MHSDMGFWDVASFFWTGGFMSDYLTYRASHWYRIEDHLVSAGVDEFDNSIGPPQLVVRIMEFPVIRTTNTGVWLNRGYMGKRFCRLVCWKRYACPSLEDALESFLARKNKQIRIYKARIDNAIYAKQKAEQEVKFRLKSQPEKILL